MKTPGRWIGAVGVRRLEAEAKNSSEKARMREFRGAEMRSVDGGVRGGWSRVERERYRYR